MQDNEKTIFGLAEEILIRYASKGNANHYEGTFDAGPAILSALVADKDSKRKYISSTNALNTWLKGLEDISTTGSFGGLSAIFVGVQMASSYYPKLLSLCDTIRTTLISSTENLKFSNERSWQEYDLISGPSGIILSLCADADTDKRNLTPAVLYLSSLCGNNSLENLRILSYKNDSLRSWNFGRINTGLAHGVTGIAAALNYAAQTGSAEQEIIINSLKRICNWLMDEAFIDELGLLSWSPSSIEKGSKPNKASTRQAWCYGTPGIAWTLWESSRILNDNRMKEFAEEAMRSYCKIFNEQLYLDKEPVDSTLGVCHGAAGILLIADAFHKHASLFEAADLAKRLEEYLLQNVMDIKSLADENMTLLTGSSGILSALIVRHGGRRNWLAQLGLR